MEKAFQGFKLYLLIVYLLSVSLVYARSPWISDFKDGPAAAPSSLAGGPVDSQSVSVGGGWNSRMVVVMMVMVVAGSVGGGCATLFVGVCVYTLAKRKWSSAVVPCRNTMVSHSTSDCNEGKIAIEGFAVERGSIVMSIEDLKMVTSNFSQDNILGRGGFGTVYKGELHDGTKVAVKRMESRVMRNFGLVRPAIDGKYSHFTRLAGTFGYFAPEYAAMGQVTTKIDVFSFGVILMELVSGRRAVHQTQEEESVSLVHWFKRKHGNFQTVIDPTLDLDKDALVSVGTMAELASHCCACKPHLRPDMSHVVNVLSSLAEPWKLS
ncbi:hypothetical protein QVD17_18999 [Tagetes erecta]|uniref:Protein kinase domain-containing protein n=1 Tax=Tagetes erecta TaxID=13708 RepID=A0AAD8NWU9_TARER|nr:hypothetical protein QVD17_18999 [Tagetes erecta]